MIRRSFRHVATVLLLLVALFSGQVTWALAGTTGGLSGVVLDAGTSAPVAGAQVTAVSPSQSVSATTDAGGHFTFLTLAPDNYTVTVSKSGYQSTSVPGNIVFADTVQTIAVRITKALQTIARVNAVGAGALVKSGTTADVYSVNAATQAATAALGGGGNLNSVYSAISTVPGAYVVPNQSGYMDTVHIRGGDFDQVGYEFDGVPVNRSFDNYSSGAASSLGNAEVQVYTGATPADSEGQGLAGYINQVIRTGTYPGFADAQFGIGTPVYYHRAAVEAGGATPDRLFSYYVGIAGYNNGYEYVNNQNGSNYQSWLGQPIAPMNDPAYANGGYFLGPFAYQGTGYFATTASRDAVFNVHIGIPHHNDGGRDDIQILYDSSALFNSFYSSTNDMASSQCNTPATGSASAAACYTYIDTVGNGWPAPPPYLDGFQWNCASGVTFTAGSLAAAGPGCTKNYFFPASTGRTLTFSQCANSGNFGACSIPYDARDSSQNNQEIVKLQYTKNFGSSAFFRVYGYTYYSNWILAGPQCTFTDYACPEAPDYELSSHTRGVSAQLSDQINEQNLVTLQGSYVTASTIRDNNTQMVNFTGQRSNAAVLVNAGEPYSGHCYNDNGSQGFCAPPGVPNFTTGVNSWLSWSQLQGGAVPAITAGSCPLAGSPSQACTYLLAENSQYATYNNVQPAFAGTSLTDEYRPGDKWLFNLGLRLDSFTFNGLNGEINNNGGAARQFFYNAYNLDTCVNNATGAQIPNANAAGAATPGAPCPAGTHSAALVNLPYQSFTFNIFQPRFSGTYTVNSDTVIRASAGRYTEAPDAAYQIYNTLENDLPFALLGPNLYPYGRNAPGIPIQPPTSINYDVSWEQRVHGTDWSFKLTPFLRQTQDQVQNFYLNQATGFISGTNVGSQRSEGFEFQLQKGDFSRNGLSGLLSFAYTNSYIKYGTLPNSNGTILSPINAAIAEYNAYTKACNPGGALYGKSQYGQSLCGSTSSGVAAARCYAGGHADPGCTALNVGGTVYQPVANPYYNATGQGFFNPAADYATYDVFPSGIGSSVDAFGSPYVGTLVLNYRENKLAITPSFQFQAGNRYGAPETTAGIDPAYSGCTPLAGSTRYNANTCFASGGAFANPAIGLVIPDPYTGVYDNLGAFVQPTEFMMNIQGTYDLTPKIQLTATLANIVNTCWGGTQTPWTYGDHNICSYGAVANGAFPGIGSRTCSTTKGVTCNPGQTIQPFLYYPYQPYFGPALTSALNNSVKAPFQMYFSANIKI
ncbi:MAG TPA: TonB-dependent receptor [Candidatus Acidoferrales bacterium]|nr:TonB-dependent receptor [Candidatus Acidoferrales bacterium]